MSIAPVHKLDLLLHYLWRDFDEYSYSPEKDRKYFTRLLEEFSDLDLSEELRQYHAWVLDQPEHKKIYYRSRFRSWLKTSREFREMKSLPKKPLPEWVRRRYAMSRY